MDKPGMPVHITRSRLAVAALVTLTLAGCGAGSRLSKSEYEQKVRTEYAGVQDAFRATAASFGQPGLAEKIKQAQAQLREAAEQLERAKPPERVEKQNEELVEGMRKYARNLDELRAAAERGDGKLIEAFNGRIAQNEAVKQMAEAAEEMKFKGYDLGPIAEE